MDIPNPGHGSAAPAGEQFVRTRNVLIPLADGTELAGDLRVPAAGGAAPALVTYMPYHKDAMFASSFDVANDLFAQNGYAVLVVDVRGLGASGGRAGEALDAQEGHDAAAVIEWAAAQPWCNGRVGMWGISYGGITTFRAAAERPPALKAIVPILGCLDGYRDAMCPGGVRNCLGVVGVWGSMMLALQLMPPMWQDPEGRWRRVWLERLEGSRPWMLPWQQHPDADDFWADKSTEAERIEVPSFLIGGWRDIFPEAMVRAYERIAAPKKLWMGPWLHGEPDASPLCAVEYLEEMLRWWDRWLRNEDNGIDREPPVTLYVQEGDGWRHEAAWPIARTDVRRLELCADGGLEEGVADKPAWMRYVCDPTVGTAAGLWEPLALGLGLPLDQGEDDARSLTFTTLPLKEDWEITGDPRARLHFRVVEGDDVMLAAKLVVVHADGRASLITTGVLRASHREGSECPLPVPIGEDLTAEIPLWTTSYLVRRGERLRLSVACADFPRFWPTPTNPVIEVGVGGTDGSWVHVPRVPATAPLPGPDIPAADPSVERYPLVLTADPVWTLERDLAHDGVSVSTGIHLEFITPDHEGGVAMHHVATASVRRNCPDGARVRAESELRLHTSDGREVVVTSSTDVEQRGASLRGTVEIDGKQAFQRSWLS